MFHKFEQEKKKEESIRTSKFKFLPIKIRDKNLGRSEMDGTQNKKWVTTPLPTTIQEEPEELEPEQEKKRKKSKTKVVRFLGLVLYF